MFGIDDPSSQILWTNYFIKMQGYYIDDTIVYQENQSAILLKRYGNQSSSKCTRYMNIRYFFITDRIKQRQMMVGYCLASEMIGDYFTKPLQGALFCKFQAIIMNINKEVPDVYLAWER